MRVVSGKAKGRKLLAVPGEGTRPILDRVKTALFDVIRPRIQGIEMLDLFAGSGSVGIEALSQGAAACTFLDISRHAVETIKKNLEITGLSGGEVYNQDSFAFLRKSKKSFDLIYIAPPQYKSLWVEALHHLAERPQLLKADGFAIVQIDPGEYEKVEMSDFYEADQRKYGNTLLIFYERPER